MRKTDCPITCWQNKSGYRKKVWNSSERKPWPDINWHSTGATVTPGVSEWVVTPGTFSQYIITCPFVTTRNSSQVSIRKHSSLRCPLDYRQFYQLGLMQCFHLSFWGYPKCVKCVRLSRPLVGFWTHFKSPHFHSFIYFIPLIPTQATQQSS